MPRSELTIITNMCLIENADGHIVMQRRESSRYIWSGWFLQGCHVEHRENLQDSVVCEIFEETGLHISNPKLVGVKHFQTLDDERYLVFCYKATVF